MSRLSKIGLNSFNLSGISKSKSGGYPLPSGCVSYWHFNESSGISAADVLGGNNGTVEGTENWPLGKFGNAFSFNGATDIYVAPNTNFNSIGSTTIAFWVYPNSFTGWTSPAGVRENSSGVFTWIIYFMVDGSLFLNLMTEGGQVANYAPSTILEIGRWQHFVITVDNLAVTYYIDGAYTEQTEGGVISSDASLPLYIGQEGAGSYINGLIDDIAIFNRALTPEEILAIASNGEMIP